MADTALNVQTPTQAQVLSVDAMGSDKGPSTIIQGIAKFSQDNPDVRFLLHGDGRELEALIAQHKVGQCCEVVHAESVVTMNDKPTHVMRHGRKTSMWSAVHSVSQGRASGCISCGNTGALMAISMMQLRKLAEVNRPAIAVVWPSLNHSGFNVVLDVGADVRADEDDLLQYAMMGAAYAQKAGLVSGLPRVGLLNVGTERQKGRSHLRTAHELLEDAQRLGEFEFIGFVEGGDLASSKVDVIITDGFTGNVALKTAEGTAEFIGVTLREAFRNSLLSRFAVLLALTSLKRMRKRIDPRRVNGGVFLGLNGTVVKSHGSADAVGVDSALRLASRLAATRLEQHIEERIRALGEFDADDNTISNKGAYL